MKLIVPSILSADFARLGAEIRAVEAAGADWIHIDVMDGHFVPGITIGPPVVKAVRPFTHLPLDVHLMIEKPENHIAAFAEAGADWISVQVETCIHLHRTLALIRSLGKKAGVALNPATPLTAVEWVLEAVDLVMLMSVNPGFGGQRFIPSTLDKLKHLRRMLADARSRALVAVDGGINVDTIQAAAGAGADVFVAGSAVFGRPDYAEAIAVLRRRASETGPDRTLSG